MLSSFLEAASIRTPVKISRPYMNGVSSKMVFSAFTSFSALTDPPNRMNGVNPSTNSRLIFTSIFCLTNGLRT